MIETIAWTMLSLITYGFLGALGVAASRHLSALLSVEDDNARWWLDVASAILPALVMPAIIGVILAVRMLRWLFRPKMARAQARIIRRHPRGSDHE